MDQVKVLPTNDVPRLSRLRSVMIEARTTFREGGLRAVVRRYGWRFFAIFFVYYLTRDLIIYVALPWLIAHQLTS